MKDKAIDRDYKKSYIIRLDQSEKLIIYIYIYTYEIDFLKLRWEHTTMTQFGALLGLLL